MNESRVPDTTVEERFERWWATYAIHQRGHASYVIDSYYNVARAAWLEALGHIPKDHADERIERLEDRAQYLRQKIFNYRPQPMHRAKAELSALEWAIPFVIQATAPKDAERAKEGK